MLRAVFRALVCCVSLLAPMAALAGTWSYRAYEQDGVRWHTLSLEDHGYRLAFFCHGASDGIKVSLRTPDPLFLPTAFAVTDRDRVPQDLRIAGRDVIAGPYQATISVDQNSSYDLEFFHVSFYGVLARNDEGHTLQDLLTHLRSARSVTLTRVGDTDPGNGRPLAIFDLVATDGAFARLHALCGTTPPQDPPPTAEQGAS